MLSTVHPTRVGTLLFSFAAVASLALSLSCSVKSAESAAPRLPEIPPPPQQQTAEVGQDFTVKGDLNAAGAFTLTRDVAFRLTAEADLVTQERQLMSECEGDAVMSDPTFFVSNAAADIKRGTQAKDGFALVDAVSFPGKLPAGDYVLSIVFKSTGACTLSEAAFALVKVVPPSVAANSELVGLWVTETPGIFREEMTIAADGTTAEKAWVQGELYLDIVSSSVVDATTTPKRALSTITKINFANPETGLAVGSQNFCIYRLSGNVLDMQCDTSYPSAFDDDATHYTKQ